MAIMVTFFGPRNWLICREKVRGVRGPRPLGSGMGSSAFLQSGHKYCHNGDMALAYHRDGASRREVPAEGSAIGIVAPFVVP
jgi:hypothetical protein